MFTFAPRRLHSRATIAPNRSTASLSPLGDSHRTNRPSKRTISPWRFRASRTKSRIATLSVVIDAILSAALELRHVVSLFVFRATEPSKQVLAIRRIQLRQISPDLILHGKCYI
jgi:hypothetical protein